MNTKIKVSIIVPVYNAEKYLDRCMDSIHQQTLKDYEVIFVNDGSTDNSLKKCLSFVQNDSKIKVIDKNNEGAGPTRNRGIEVATGEYLAFPDADDWFAPDMYEKLYALAVTYDADIVFSGINHYYRNNEGELYLHHQSICKQVNFKTKDECRKGVMELFPTTTIFDGPCTKLYKRSVAIDNNVYFTNAKRCQDAIFNLDFYNVATKIVSTTEVFYNYMENMQTDVWRKFPINYKDIVIFYNQHLKNRLQEWDMFEGDVRIHYDSSFVLAIYSVLVLCDNPNWKFNKKQKIEYVYSILNHPYVVQRMKDLITRPDVEDERKLILSKKASAVFSRIRKEKMKDFLRKSSVIRWIYHLLKK